MTDCPFCKIVSGEYASKRVAETEHAIAFHDISPAQPVHVLVVPKQHFRDVAELSERNEEILLDVMKLGTRVAADLTDGSFRFQFNTGADAGQTVFHAHGHITSRNPKS